MPDRGAMPHAVPRHQATICDCPMADGRSIDRPRNPSTMAISCRDLIRYLEWRAVATSPEHLGFTLPRSTREVRALL
jgi:hypothetical protein